MGKTCYFNAVVGIPNPYKHIHYVFFPLYPSVAPGSRPLQKPITFIIIRMRGVGDGDDPIGTMRHKMRQSNSFTTQPERRVDDSMNRWTHSDIVLRYWMRR